MSSLTVGGLWLQRQQAEEARQSEALRRDVGAELAQAKRFRQSAHFKESRELLEQAQRRLGTDGPADLREQVDQALADTALAKRLDAARQLALTRLEGGKSAKDVAGQGVLTRLAGPKLDTARAEKEYAAACQEAGLGQEGEDAEEVAARVRASPVRAELVAALDAWAGIAGDGPRRTWLLAVARAADPDTERDHLRQPELWRDGAALAKLAKKSRVAALSPQLAAALGGQVGRKNIEDEAPLLREALAHYPRDFWLNLHMAFALHQTKQLEEAIGYYRVALALRPEASVHYSLGVALKEKGRVDEAIGHYKQAVHIDPDNSYAHTNLRNALSDKCRLDHAIRHLKTAVRINPEDPHTHSN